MYASVQMFGQLERGITMRNPNGMGTVKKLSGKRRKPFSAVITTGYELKNGKMVQIQKSIGYYETRQDAMLALADHYRNPFDLDKRNTTFGQIYDILEEQKFNNMKEQAKRAYKTAYKKCESIKRMKMTEIRKAHMQAILDKHSKKSASTQNAIIVLLRAVYRFALENDIVEKDYSQFLEITSTQEKKKKIPFSREEVQKLWDMKEDWARDSILILLYTGMRIEELLTLRREDIHLEERYIDLQGTKTKAAVRIIPIHKKIAPLLEKRLTGEYLYPAIRKGKSKTLSYLTYRNSFDPLMETLGTEHTPHDTRHTFVSIAGACNMNPVLLKKITGHSAQDITQDVYTHAYLEDLIAEIDKFDY